LHYPAVPESSDYKPEVDIRAGAHSDYGSITLLFQRPGQPGLEILTPSKEWSPVPVHPPGTDPNALPPILVNIGDLLSYWTNRLLKSTVHRVIFPSDSRRGGEDRYSIAYFCHPVNDTKLVAVPSALVDMINVSNSSGDSKIMTAEEHLNSRLAATYGWGKEEQKA
jgi:isopenicillin N synthase-like dioxygenase